jgi:hypothetical protein
MRCKGLSMMVAIFKNTVFNMSTALGVSEIMS